MNNAKKKKIFSDSLFITFGTLIKKIRGLIFLPVIIHYVGIHNYGAFVQITINARLLTPFCTMALGMGFMRFSSKYDDIARLSRDYWTVFFAGCLFSLLGCLCILATSPLINDYILGGNHLAALQLSPLLLINNALWTQNNKFLKSVKRFKLFAVYDILFHILPYLGFIAGIILYKDIFQGLLGFILIQMLLIIILIRINTKELAFSWPSFAVFKQFISYTWPMPFSEMAGGLLSKIDRYFIGFFLGPSAIGIYNIAFNIASILFELSKPFILYFSVYMPKLWDRGESKTVMTQLRTGLIYYIMVCAGLWMLLSCYAEQLLNLLIDKEMTAGFEFNYIVSFLGLGVLVRGVTSFYFEIIKFVKKTQIIFYLHALAAATNSLLNYLSIPRLGIMGAALTTVITYAGIWLISVQVFPINPTLEFKKKILKILLICFFICILNFLNPGDGVFHLFAGMALSSFIYVLLLLITKAITFKDLCKSFTYFKIIKTEK